MKVRYSKTPLPRYWGDTMKGADRALGLWDIRVTGGSRLFMKMAMFRNNRDLRYFWRHALGSSDLCSRTRGCVRNLATEVTDYSKGPDAKPFMEVDPRYFAVMGLIQGHTNDEILCHEAVHAAFAYAKRVGHRNLWAGARTLDEEMICYPAGRIMRFVKNAIKDL